MYYIGLDVHKKTISYCVKDAAGKIHQEGKIGSTRGLSHSHQLLSVKLLESCTNQTPLRLTAAHFSKRAVPQALARKTGKSGLNRLVDPLNFGSGSVVTNHNGPIAFAEPKVGPRPRAGPSLK